MIDPNREAPQSVATALGDMKDEVVFLGGAITGVLITDLASSDIRTTKDVDCIIEVSSRSDYDHRIRQQLLDCGFKELVGDNIPICAWQRDGIRFDVMPTDANILGFSNPWYKDALKHAEVVDIGEIEINIVHSPYFLATKFVAFHSRGKSDIVASHDLEDLVAVIEGRESVSKEVAAADENVRVFIAEQLRFLLKNQDFLQALPGLVLDPGREIVVLERMEYIASVR